MLDNLAATEKGTYWRRLQPWLLSPPLGPVRAQLQYHLRMHPLPVQKGDSNLDGQGQRFRPTMFSTSQQPGPAPLSSYWASAIYSGEHDPVSTDFFALALWPFRRPKRGFATAE